ncbi:MAG: DUF2726 domain-containing protein [Burkholderiaceae bacterium]|nr:DUF2726 domain-containing protein [Burkholderiaceae bacterium]
MPLTLPWIVALASSLCMLAMACAWFLTRPRNTAAKLPTHWAITARPVFSADERRAYRALKDALPHHVILAKLPLVRFCQPTEAQEVKYWFDLLGANHVAFAICSPNGRVLAAVDLESERSRSTRGTQIKLAVMNACRVRYLRCSIDKFPSAAELQLLVPFSNSSARGPQAAPLTPSPQPGAHHGGMRPLARGNLWKDSTLFSDSFFTPDNRFDSATGRVPAHMRDNVTMGAAAFEARRSFAEPLEAASQFPDEAPNDIVGVVIDTPPRYSRR